MSVGAAIASTGTIFLDPNNATVHITGVNTIQTLHVNGGLDTGVAGAAAASLTARNIFHGPFYLIADGAWATNAAGNIMPKTTGARTVGDVVCFMHDPATAVWYEL